MKAMDFKGDLDKFLRDYAYQPELVQHLDQLAGTQFTQAVVNEIVLWKVNRFVSLDSSILKSISLLRDLAPGQHRQGEAVLRQLIETRGVDLPMASTFLRFQNPHVFQIIDRHAYRAVYDQNYSLYAGSNPKKKVATYFDYLDRLHELCETKGLDFETVDRLLYEFDRQVNGNLG